VEVIDLQSSNLNGELFHELYGFEGLEMGSTKWLPENRGDSK
jgi:hypothetical protein